MSLSYSKPLIVSLLVIFTVFFSLSKTFAVSPSSVIVKVAPESYTPAENVEISLSSFAANLDSVLITWVVNGRDASSGIGKKSFSITAPAAGAETNIVVKILFPDGELQKNILIKPNVLTLLWQANDSYVPPFYKGKAFPTLDSEIKVVAMPEIKTGNTIVDPKNMIYSWKKDYENEAGSSGYGKNFFVYTNDYLESTNNIEVVVSTIDQQQSSGKNINVSATSSEILFYKNDNNLGTMWEKTLENGDTVKDGENILAIPYFISPEDIRRPELIFNWFVNDIQTNVQNLRKNLVPIKVQAGASGTSKLRLEIENRDKIFQTVDKEIELNF